jgi:hypothetical protein
MPSTSRAEWGPKFSPRGVTAIQIFRGVSENRQPIAAAIHVGRRVVNANRGRKVTQIAQTTMCMIMRAHASGQPPPVVRDVASRTSGMKDKTSTVVAT